jgi:hypothetical protein
MPLDPELGLQRLARGDGLLPPLSNLLDVLWVDVLEPAAAE